MEVINTIKGKQMNNPLAQKYNYYLNESHRLNEELKSEEEYSELLENVLFDILGEEDFTKLFEYVMKGTVTHDGQYNPQPLSADRSARRAKRIGQIVALGRTAAGKKDEQLTDRVAKSLVAKGADSPSVRGASMNTRGSNVSTALKTGDKIKIRPDSSMGTIRQEYDDDQIKMSKARRDKISGKKEEDKNTF